MTTWGQPGGQRQRFGPADPQQVNDFHAADDTDTSQLAHHHTLGRSPTQAAPGDHLHDGTSSAVLPGWTVLKPLGAGLDDAPRINLALALAPEGGGVELAPGGDFLVGSPILLDRLKTIRGAYGARWQYRFDPAPAVINCLASFAGAGVIVMRDKEVVGGSVEQGGQRVENLSLRGSDLVAANVDGIHATGFVSDVRLVNLSIRKMTGHGVNTDVYVRVDTSNYYPRGWEASHVASENNTGAGFKHTLLTDSVHLECLAFSNGSHGFDFNGVGDNLVAGCKAPFNGARGYSVVGDNTGTMIFAGCSSDRSQQEGFYAGAVSGGTGLVSGQAIQFVGCSARRDGRNADAGGGNYAGFRGNNTLVPLVYDGCVTCPGVNDGGVPAATESPQHGMRFVGCSDVRISNCYAWGNSRGLSEGGGNVRFRVDPLTTSASGAHNAVPTVCEPLDWEEEFLANLQQFHWLQTFFTGAGATSATVQAEGGRPGIHAFTTGTTAAGSSELRTYNNAVRTASGRLSAEWIVRIPTLSTALEEFAFRCGFLDAAGVPVDGAYFEYDRTGSVNWRYGTRANSVGAPAASAVAVTAGQWYHLKVVVNDPATNVDFLIDGVLVAQVTTNIPTGAGRETGVGMHIIKSVGTTSRSVEVDLARFSHWPSAAAR